MLGKIEEEWQELAMTMYNNVTIPKTQYQEMRYLFYCGFMSAYAMFVEKFKGLSENEITETIENLQSELIAFGDEILMRNEVLMRKNSSDNV